MKAIRTFLSLGFLFVAWTITAAAQGKSLADIARENRARQSQTAAPTPTPAAAPHVEDDEITYTRRIQSLVAQGAFADLDTAANSARTTRERFAGGVWKLYVFYDAVTSPHSADVSAAAWTQKVTKLKNWVAARPQSIAARVALAETYRSLAWSERGSGYADTVTQTGWQQFGKYQELAYKTLIEAGELPAKCPHWYFLMLEIARDRGWTRDQTRALFDRAVAFEPAYYHYYREYAFNLLPKWNGEPGEAEAFAEASYRRIGGRQGAFVYFEIATVVYCMCDDKPVTPTLSWSTIQEGFAEVEEHYGATPLKLNRFALLAYLFQDRAVANPMLVRVGEQWDPALWQSTSAFNSVRTWAGLPPL